jgi:hypothetical protein
MDAVFITYISLIGISIASKKVEYVCLSIWYIMRPQCIPKPTRQHCELTALEFERRANFPYSLGAVDKKYNRLIKPKHSSAMFYNYKDFFSRCISSRCRPDTTYLYVCVEIGSYGKDCNFTILKRSTLWTSIQTNMLELSSERPLAGTEGSNVPHFFIGDEELALNKNVLRHFGGSNLSFNKGVYRYWLCRA